MAIPNKNVLGDPNVTEGDFQLAIESLRESVIGSGKAYDSANTYAQYDFCTYSGISYYSKVAGNIGNTPSVGANWGYTTDILNAVQKVTTTDNCIMRADGTGGAVQASSVYIDDSGNLLVTGSGGLGYGTGSGGEVTQLTSKSTSVTLNKPSCSIITSNETLAAGASAEFSLNNSFISPAAIDTVVLTPIFGAVDPRDYDIKVSFLGGGNMGIKIKNISAVSKSDALVLQVNVFKGAKS